MSEEMEKKSRKVSKPVAALAGLGLALGMGWTLSSGLKDPPSQMITSKSQVRLAVPYRGICTDLKVLNEGQTLPLTSRDIKGGLARLDFELPVGEHDLRLQFQGPIPGLERDYPLQVTVDRDPPSLSASLEGLAESRVTTSESLELIAATEPGAELFLEGESLPISDQGEVRQSITLEPGWNHLLLTAQDAAGNETRVRQSVFRDTEEPEISWNTTPEQAFNKKFARLELDLSDDGEIGGVSGKVDGDKPVTWHAKGNGRWVGVTPELHEGFHTVTVRAVDRSGRIVSGERKVLIDSSEALGEAVLGLGARGQDVKLLNERLAEAGYLAKDAVSSVFTRKTEMALKQLQNAEGYEVSGKAEGKTLVALGPRIFINLSRFSLVLDRPGKDQRRWLIASGSYAHPTPVGKFVIKEKVYHPTWLPPKSDWAKDAKPIPPGPGNPLGTRWLGFDWGGVGIHGTNAPWTVGTAASHGCLRMVTGQVEELFELVEVGTPVVVLGGWEKNPALERYWPTQKPEAEKTPEESIEATNDGKHDEVASR